MACAVPLHAAAVLELIQIDKICDINGLVQDWCNSIALAMELLQPCTKPLICVNGLGQDCGISSALEIPQFCDKLQIQYVFETFWFEIYLYFTQYLVGFVIL